MQIGLFADCWEPQVNGVVIAIKNLREAIESYGYQTTVFAPAIRPYWRSSTADYKQFAVRYPFQREFALATPWPFRALATARQQGIQIVHAHTEFSLGQVAFQIAKRIGVPFVFTLHTLWKYYAHYLFWGLLPYSLLARVMRRFYQLPDYFIIPTARIKDYLVTEFGVKAPITVIPTGLDLSRFMNFKPDSKKLSGFRQVYGLKETDKIAIFVGRLGKEKSIEVLLKGLRRLTPRQPHIRLLIVGDGPERKELARLVIRLNLKEEVRFAGYLNWQDLPLAYRACDFFVLASRTETQGLVTVEAMASGLPVIVAEDKVNLEIVGSKENGLFFNNEQELALRLEELILSQPLYQKLSERSLQRAKFFTLEAYGQRMHEYYQHVARDFKSRCRSI